MEQWLWWDMVAGALPAMCCRLVLGAAMDSGLDHKRTHLNGLSTMADLTEVRRLHCISSGLELKVQT